MDTLILKLFNDIQNLKYYYFGVLTSSVHMAWMRTTCGRLESRYQYSATIVYNNFLWCSPTEKQRKKIELTAQNILNVRKNYPNQTLADLYDDLLMPADLRKAHNENDRAVLQAYGFNASMTESEIVAALMKMYRDLAT